MLFASRQRAFSSFLCRLPPAQHVFYLRLSIALSRRRVPRSHKNKMVTLLKSIEKDDPTRRGIRKAPAALPHANTREHARHGALDDAVTATDETRLPAKEKN